MGTVFVFIQQVYDRRDLTRNSIIKPFKNIKVVIQLSTIRDILKNQLLFNKYSNKFRTPIIIFIFYGTCLLQFSFYFSKDSQQVLIIRLTNQLKCIESRSDILFIGAAFLPQNDLMIINVLNSFIINFYYTWKLVLKKRSIGETSEVPKKMDNKP